MDSERDVEPALFAPLGLDIELHEVRRARLRELTEVLTAHAAAEDAGMYPRGRWAGRK